MANSALGGEGAVCGESEDSLGAGLALGSRRFCRPCI
jgi:hypothetical protein